MNSTLHPLDPNWAPPSTSVPSFVVQSPTMERALDADRGSAPHGAVHDPHRRNDHVQGEPSSCPGHTGRRRSSSRSVSPSPDWSPSLRQLSRSSSRLKRKNAASLTALALKASHGYLNTPSSATSLGASGVSLLECLQLGVKAKTRGRSGQGVHGAPSPQRSSLVLAGWEKALFSVAYVTVRDNELPKFLSWLFLFLEDLQLLSFAFAPRLDPNLPWLFSVIIEPIRLLSDYTQFIAANAIALLMIAMTIGLALYVGTLVIHAGRVPIPALRLLRLLFSIQMTVLSIPMAQLLIGGLNCLGGTLEKYDVQCFAGRHLPLFIADVVGLVLFVPLVAVGSLLFLDTQPSSHSPDAKAHGRSDLKTVLLRLAFVALDSYTHPTAHDHPTTTFHPARADWWFMSLVAIGLAYLAVTMAYTQPYFDARYTAVRTAFATSACLAMAAAMVSVGAGMGHDMWLVPMVPVAATGWVVGFAGSWMSGRFQFEQSVRKWFYARKLETERRASADSRRAMPMQQTMDVGPGGYQKDGGRAHWAGFTSSIKSLAREPAARRRSSHLDDHHGVSILAAQPAVSAVPVREMTLTSAQPGARSSPGFDASGDVRDPPALPAAAPLSAGSQHVDHVAIQPSRGDAIVDNRQIDIRLMSRSASFGGSMDDGSDLDPGSDLDQYAAEDPFLLRLTQVSSTDVLAMAHSVELPPPAVFRSPLQVEACLRFIRNNPTDDQVIIGLHLLDRGLQQFDDALLQYLAAVYLRTYFGTEGQYAATDLLDAVTSKRELPFDLKFLVFAHDRHQADQRRARGLGGTEGLQVLENVELQNLDRKCKQAHLRSLTTLREIFDALHAQSSDGRVVAAVKALTQARIEASDCYTKLLELLPKSKNVLRSYAQFLMVVEGNQIKASRILEQVEEAEILESRVSRGPRLSTDLGASCARVSDFRSRDDFISRSRGDFAIPRTANSAPSEASTDSRFQRQRMVQRQALYARVLRSYTPTTLIPAVILLALYLACLAVGLVLALQFFDSCNTVVSKELSLARNARMKITEALDGMHLMGYSNFFASGWPGYVDAMAAEFDVGYKQVSAALADLERDGLPYVAAQPIMTVPNVRVFAQEQLQLGITVTNFQAADMSTLDLATTVYKAGLMALQYPVFGMFSDAVYEAPQTPTLFVFDNYKNVFDAINQLPKLGLTQFVALIGRAFNTLLVVTVFATAAIVGTAGYALYWPVAGYFGTQAKLLKVLRTIPKRVAQSMVTTLDAEIEAFHEVRGIDETGEVAGHQGDGSAASGLERAAVLLASHRAEGRASGGSASGRSGEVFTPPARAHALVKRGIMAAAVVAVMLTVGTFLLPLSATTSERQIQELLNSNQRHQALTVINLKIREVVFPSTILFKATSAIGAVVEAIADLEDAQVLVTSPSNVHSVTAALPDLTTLAMPCTSPTLPWCNTTLPGGLGNDIITKPGSPLDQAIWSAIDLAKGLVASAQPGCELVGATLDPTWTEVGPLGGNVSITPMNPHDGNLLLFRKTLHDVRVRLDMVDAAMRAKIVDQLEWDGEVFLGLWALTLVAVLVVAAWLAYGAMRTWRDRAVSLATVLVMMPGAYVTKAQWSEGFAFVETGGVALDTGESDSDEGAIGA
ncbi:hypothetical protein AMAG_07934 [Allomyces macrogynus ATCC 38327]|uniref:TmcB/TmcC TPR repeats domain-containing protein n=1 Tax=Allomyces macrogynus (strain ATCC 38327) TaxID=578462 RepID=A0A0L0SJT9_ALLM3|nr:hypothetical protein AMAG_07934 [Allomyces macrogynus ATCC 38327]|eukprot:KNE62748.1 hypothetical protein AMAG_07934 [Allomyces macrogynus ATCC 38327]